MRTSTIAAITSIVVLHAACKITTVDPGDGGATGGSSTGTAGSGGASGATGSGGATTGTGGAAGSTTGSGGTTGKGGAAGTGGTAGSGGATGGTAGTGGSGGSSGGGDSGVTQVDGQIVRTLAYHEVTAFTTSPIRSTAKISGNGSRIAYSGGGCVPADPLKPNEVYVVNSDGTGTMTVDSYPANCNCCSAIAISGDGNSVVSTESMQVRVVGASGTMKGALSFTSNEVSDIDVTDDGATVFMMHRRNNTIAAPAMNIERGLWAMNADGTNLRQLAGATSVAPLFATTPDMVFPFAGCGKSLDASASGQRVVFAVQVGAEQFAMTLEGTTVKRLKGPMQNVYQVAISGDGTKVAVSSAATGMQDVTVMNFDGTGSRVVTTDPQGSCFSPLALNGDGSQLVSGDIARLYPTAGGDSIPLLLATGGWGGQAIPIGTDAFDVGPGASMTTDGKRFAYLNFDGLPAHPGTKQIALIDLNPANVGAAPAVSAPTFAPATIPTDRSIASTLTARIAGGGTLVGAGSSVILGGVEDTAGNWVAGRLEMRDDGMMGDRTASDGVFTSRGGIHAGTGATLGARIVRIKAESKAADGRRQATAIDVGGLQIR